MAKLVDSKETIAVLQRTNFQFKKQFGQNFLIDASVLDHIISHAKIQKEDSGLQRIGMAFHCLFTR